MSDPNDLFSEWPTFQDPNSIEAKWHQFDKDHPEVYLQLVKLARQWMSHGRTRLGISTLFEKLRWEWHVSDLQDRDGFKLNNNYRSLYARKIMALNPDLKDIFETRTLTTTRSEHDGN